MKIPRNILLTPGPATTSDSVKEAQVVADICPREKEFGQVMQFINQKLTEIAGGNSEHVTTLFCGSGTAGMDAAINSVVPKDKKILIINNGAYGERMVKIAKAYSIEVVELKFPYSYPSLEQIKSTLKEDPEIAAVAMVHHETSTGMLNPLAEVAELATEKVFIVDAISSFAGIPFSLNNIDFLISSSNKCIQGMPGCAFIISKLTSLQKIADIPPRSFYLNLYQQHQYFEKHKQMQFTPPVQCLYALKKAIEEFLEEGLENRYQRYSKNWEVLIAGMQELGFKKLLPDAQESKILTTFHYPNEDFDFEKLHDLLFSKGFTIYPGKIGGKNTFRLANLGDLRVEDIQAFLKELKVILPQL